MLQTALRFLDEHKEITLATCEGNLPKLRVFQVMKREGNMLYFATSPENVELLAYADNVSVRCSGMVNFDMEDDVRQWIYENNPVLPRLYTSWERLAYFCLPIAEMDYFDLTPTPPVFKHFDLMTGEVSNGFVGKRFKNK